MINDFAPRKFDRLHVNSAGTQWWIDHYDIMRGLELRTIYWFDGPDADGDYKTMHFAFEKVEDF